MSAYSLRTRPQDWATIQAHAARPRRIFANTFNSGRIATFIGDQHDARRFVSSAVNSFCHGGPLRHSTELRARTDTVQRVHRLAAARRGKLVAPPWTWPVIRRQLKR